MIRSVAVWARALKQSLRHSRWNDWVERARNHFFYEDVFLVSFPKSGNTWVRFLLTSYYLWIEQEGRSETNYYNIHTYVPDIHLGRISDWRPTHGLPRLIKSHRCFTPNYKRVIYIVRDVRDAMISRFHFINRNRRVFDSFDDFLRHPQFGVPSWCRHVDTWLGSPMARQGRLLLVRFEDLKRAPDEQIRRMWRFMNVHIPNEAVEWSVRMGDADRVRRLEAEFARARVSAVPFLRTGEAEQWKVDMSPARVAQVLSVARPAMERAGYAPELMLQER